MQPRISCLVSYQVTLACTNSEGHISIESSRRDKNSPHLFIGGKLVEPNALHAQAQKARTTETHCIHSNSEIKGASGQTAFNNVVSRSPCLQSPARTEAAKWRHQNEPLARRAIVILKIVIYRMRNTAICAYMSFMFYIKFAVIRREAKVLVMPSNGHTWSAITQYIFHENPEKLILI